MKSSAQLCGFNIFDRLGVWMQGGIFYHAKI